MRATEESALADDNSATLARLRGARGQTTPFVLSLLMMLTLLVAVVVNVGQVVNRRIALQTLADAGAYTGASELGVGFNHLARLNSYLHTAYEIVKIGTGHYTFGFSTCTTVAGWATCNSIDGVDDALIGAWEVISTVIKVIFVATDITYAIRAHTRAEFNSDWNAGDLFPGEVDLMSYSEGGDQDEYELGLAGTRNPYLVAEFEGVDETRYWYGHGCNMFDAFCFRTQTFEKWYKKSDDRPVTFVWVATAPETDFLMFPKIFGKIPEMKAAAAARPVGGNIEEGEAEYKVKLEMLEDVMLLGNRVTDAFFERTREVLH
jgi:Putative Flp pilus-assembly TadE/G-like